MKKITVVIMTLVLIFTLTACSSGKVDSTVVVSEVQLANNPVAEATTASTPAASVVDALAGNSEIHDASEDYIWDSAAVIPIVLNGDSITADVAGASVVGSQVTITSAGTYSFSGTLADGQIIVDTQDEDTVRLILNGVDIHNSTTAPIYVMNAEKTVIILADNSENFISDEDAYVIEDSETDEPNAAIFSKSDLTLYGSGSLTVNGYYNDGIASKDGLIIASGTITVSAVDDGIRGKDYLVIKDGAVTITAQGNGLKSDNEEDATKGYISMDAGILNITSSGDAIQAATDVMITGGDITIISGGGSSAQLDETISAKGIKATVGINIDGGTFTINAADDALHSNGSLTINDGTFTLASGDDGLHADSTLDINAGNIQITESYEGIESSVITINAGSIAIIASDDGINVAGGNDGSGMNPGMQPGGRGGPGGGRGQDAFSYSGNYFLYIHGGSITVDADGDGIDVNGAIEMTGGTVLVNGPTQNMNGALDYDGSFNISGGFILAAGSSGMAQAPGETSSQYSVLINFTSTLPAGTLVHVQDDQGYEIFTFEPNKEFQSIAFSSPSLVQETTYDIYTGGESTGTAVNGLFQEGTYSSGAQYASFTVSSRVTRVGMSGNRP